MSALLTLRDSLPSSMRDERCPEFGTLGCLLCTGEACNLCGAGCWSNRRDCTHDVMERHQGHDTAITEEGGCPRCLVAKANEFVLHSYEWNPPAWSGITSTIFWNVAEIRLRLLSSPGEKVVERFPYHPGFVELTCAHDLVIDHTPHIPDDKIRPSLAGNLILKDLNTGRFEPCTIMLDGHHSAFARICHMREVEIELVPTEVLMDLARRSRRDLLGPEMAVLEGRHR